MNDNMSFPTESVRDWVELEPTLKSVLRRGGASADVERRLMSRMKNVFLSYRRSWRIDAKLPLPASSSAAEVEAVRAAVVEIIADLQSKTQELMAQVLMDRLLLEIKLLGRVDAQDQVE